jgi:hypothetical protein
MNTGEMHQEINMLWCITVACDTIATEIPRYSFNHTCKTRPVETLNHEQQLPFLLTPSHGVPSSSQYELLQQHFPAAPSGSFSLL